MYIYTRLVTTSVIGCAIMSYSQFSRSHSHPIPQSQTCTIPPPPILIVPVPFTLSASSVSPAQCCYTLFSHQTGHYGHRPSCSPAVRPMHEPPGDTQPHPTPLTQAPPPPSRHRPTHMHVDTHTHPPTPTPWWRRTWRWPRPPHPPPRARGPARKTAGARSSAWSGTPCCSSTRPGSARTS